MKKSTYHDPAVTVVPEKGCACATCQNLQDRAAAKTRKKP